MMPSRAVQLLLGLIRGGDLEPHLLRLLCILHRVIVAPKSTGICGSDTHFLVHGGIGDFIVSSNIPFPSGSFGASLWGKGYSS